MNKHFLVSICVLAYNHEKTIERAISSILAQQVNFSYEVIVGDDCSSDGTAEILSHFCEEKIKTVLRKKNIGGTANCADLMRRAKGKYLLLWEGDDFFANNNTFQYMVDFMEHHPGYQGIAAKRWKVDERGRILGDNTDFDLHHNKLNLRNYLQEGKTFDLPSTLFRNQGEAFELSVMENASVNRGDAVLAILILEKGPMYLTKRYLGYYQCVNKKKGHNYNSKYNIWEQYEDIIKILKYVEKHHTPKHSYIRRYWRETKHILWYVSGNTDEYKMLLRAVRLLGFVRSGKILMFVLLSYMQKGIYGKGKKAEKKQN